MKLSSRLKLAFSLGMIFVLGFQFIALNIFRKNLIKNFKNQLLSNVELSARTIDKDLLEELIQNVSQDKLFNNASDDYLISKDSLLNLEQSYGYQEIVKELNLIRNHSFGLIHYAYILYPTKDENLARFLVDADINMGVVIDQKIFHKKIKNIASFTKLYDVSAQQATKMSLITHSSVISHSYINDTEYAFKSYMAFAPIFAKNGKYIGTLGIDMSKEVIDNFYRKFYFLTMFFVFLLVIFFIVIYFASKKIVIIPLHKLSEEIIEIEESNFEKRLNVKTNNVIGKLRKTINGLADRIQKNNENLFKLNETTLMEKEEMLITLKSIADGVIIANQKGRIIFMNNVAEKLTGFCEEESLGKPIEDIFKIIDKLSSEEIENPLLKTIKSKKVVEIRENVVLISKKQKEIYISNSAAPVIVEGNLKAAVLVFRTIPDTEKKVSDLIGFQKLESLNILAGGVAHDFNNFLTAIIGNISILKYKLKGKVDQNIIDIITRVEDASTKANGLSEQLLNFSKKDTLNKVEGNIFNLLKKSMKFSLSGRNVMQSILSKGKIFSVKFNPSQMTQVFNNLFINAAQAMPNGGTINCLVENVRLDSDELNLKGEFVKITISDHGKGIEDKYLDKIFDTFFTTKKTGNGIGLSVVKRIVKEHGGDIKVHSTLNVGTEFIIYLPAMNKFAKQEEDQSKVFRNTNSNNLILIMDDESSILDSLKGMLDMLNYQSISVMRGENAISECKKYLNTTTPFVLAILDITIKDGMGGIETAKILKELDPNIKIIFSSGYLMKNDSSTNKMLYSDVFLRKPYKMEELSVIIKNLIED
jgi:PAS domain S-box-containing protein